MIFGPGGGQAAVEGAPLWRNAIPYRHSSDTPNVGTWAQTDDTRVGMGLEGLMHLREFIKAGGVFIGSDTSAEFAITNNFTYGVSVNRPGTGSRVVGSLLRTKIVDGASPIVYGVPDNLAVYSDSGESFSVSANVGGGGRAGGGAPAGAGGGRVAQGRADAAAAPEAVPPGVEHRTTRTSFREDPHRKVRTCRRCHHLNKCSPGRYALPTDEQLKRNPATLIPPEYRPRVAMRFDAQNTLLVSGLLEGGNDIAQRPLVVDVPVGKGHVVLFANNPIYRGETIGGYFMVFNTILNFDSLDAGRKLDKR